MLSVCRTDLSGEKGVLAFKVGQPEDDVVGVGDGDAQALQEESEEV
jgi:hypothetical protein